MHNERKGIRSFPISTQSSSARVPCILTTFFNYIFLGNTLTSKSKGCSVIRALASNQYGRGLPYMWVGLLLALSFLSKDFFHGSSFSLTSRTNISKSHFDTLRVSSKEPQRGSSAINTTWHNAPNSGHIK